MQTQTTTHEPLTRQEVYDRIVGAVRDSTLPGYDAKTGTCVYNLHGCRHCVVGLFAFDLGLPMREGADLLGQPEAAIRAIETYTGMSRTELSALQGVHDTLAARWKRGDFVLELNGMEAFAKHVKLTWQVS